MTLRFEPLLGVSLETITDVLNRSFEEYIVPFHMDAVGFNARFRTEHLDFASSLIAFHGDDPAGVLLIARRGGTSRVAAMGILKAARGQGVGKAVMRRCVEDARARGDARIVLEVIESNTAARAVYKSVGFKNVRRLVGYVRDPAPSEAVQVTLEELDPAEFAGVVQREGEADLPWMLAAPTLAAYVKPWRAYALADKAFALVHTAGDRGAQVRAVVVPRAHRGQGWAQRLLEALFAMFPNRYWSFAAIMPEGLGAGVLERCEFRLDAISQFEMVCEL